MSQQLSLTGKRWLSPNSISQDMGEIVEGLLRDRNLDAPSSQPKLVDMDKAVKRIKTAVDNKERIAIFGDYDCDGITATAQLVRFFQRKGIDPLKRLPHRVHDGYGLNDSIVEEFHKANINLLITVDNGIASVDEVSLANSYGIDVIITDHHTVGEIIPDACAVLHPALSGCPEPHPSGSGIAFLLINALEEGAWEERPTDLILAMCGTIADLVALNGFNRQLVREGLIALQEIRGGPLATLRENTKSTTSTNIAFRIAPRINASGRMADPLLALEALLVGGNALEKLDVLNVQRQEQMRSLYEEARGALDLKSPLLFKADADYQHGLIGLIAGRLTEETGKPSCIVTIDGDECVASLRSPACYHITEGLTRCSDLLTRFGGHAQAAGCNFPLKNLEAFEKKLTSDVVEHTDAENLVPSLHINACITPSMLSIDFCRALQTLEPFGMGNPEPRFLLEEVELDDVRAVGADESHMQCSVLGCKAVGFGLAHLQDAISVPVDVVCRLQVDTWYGYVQPQLIIDDVRVTKRAPQRSSK